MTIIKKVCQFLLIFVGVIVMYQTIAFIASNTPTERKMREYFKARICFSQLKWIDEAKQKYAQEKGLTNGAIIGFDSLVEGGYLMEYFYCPLKEYHFWRGFPVGFNKPAKTKERSEASYNIKPLGELPLCKYSPVFHSLTSEAAITYFRSRDKQ